MENINIESIIGEIKETAENILGKDLTSMRGFSKRQLENIANQTVLVGNGIATGQISEFNRDFFLSQLVELVKTFVHSLIGLMVATIEKLWNALVNILWSAISKVAGIPLSTFKLV